MADQAALQEAIQRARKLAAKISQNAPVKRTASELEDSCSGTVKVTLAYEKPANFDRNRELNQRSSSNYRDSNYDQDSNYSRDRERDRDREDRDSSNNGSNSAFSRGGSILNASQNAYPPMLGGSHHSNSINEDRIEIIIPHAVIGLVIGKGGENIKRIQNESGATVRVDPNTVDEKGNKVCTITGTKEAVTEAHKQVSSVIDNSSTSKRPRLQSGVEGSDSYRMKIPASRTGAIIGKGGETIKSIKQQSGCEIELDKVAKECGPDESIFIIRGSKENIPVARALIDARLANRGRDSDIPAHSSHSRSGSSSKGVATGANAAPVAQFTDLPASYPAASQQTADMSAAWAAYFAQYSNLMTQAGGQPAAAGMMPYATAQGVATTATGQTMMAGPMSGQSQMMPQVDPMQSMQQPQQQLSDPAQQLDGANQAGQQQDYSMLWYEYYMSKGRPDYAAQVLEMKRQAQKQPQQQSQQPQSPSLLVDKTQ